MGLLARRFETSDRGVLLWLRWLFFLVLLSLSLYSTPENMTRWDLFRRAGLLLGYALSNIAFMVATKRGFRLQHWTVPIFVVDLLFIGWILYKSVGPDMDLYLMCFLIIYLSTLGRHIRDALPLSLIACVVYGMLLYQRNPQINLLTPEVLLRFPFFLIFALFTSYLTQQTEEGRRRIARMQEVQQQLSGELEKTMDELRDKQAMLLQAEKLSAMGSMAGALAHEIRNPLSVIIGYVEDVLAERPSEETLTKILEAVRRSALRCEVLMNNLLTFARRPREAELFSLNDALQETMDLVRVSAKMTQVQCTLEAPVPLEISARRGEIQQVFLNLMSNAVDAMPKGGMLTVLLEEDNRDSVSWVKVSIQDTGAGIPEDIRARIFEPFFTTKPPGKGTGLGLSIVRDIVRSSQGRLEVKSQPQKGTTFIVYLPSMPVANPVDSARLVV